MAQPEYVPIFAWGARIKPIENRLSLTEQAQSVVEDVDFNEFASAREVQQRCRPPG